MTLARVARACVGACSRGVHTSAPALAADKYAPAASTAAKIYRFLDGKLSHQLWNRKTGTCVGTDRNGNKYYEDRDAGHPFDRWVVFAEGTDEEASYNCTTVPPEWHGWLHRVIDEAPHNSTPYVPTYAIPSDGAHNKTGTADLYYAKGARNNAFGKRSWQKYESWQP